MDHRPPAPAAAPPAAAAAVPPAALPAPHHAARQMALLCVSVLMVNALWFSATAVLPALRDAWGLSPSASAWLTAAVQLGFVVGALGSAFLNLPDVLAPRRMVVIAALLGAAVNLVLALAVRSIGPALGLRFATGVCLAGVYPPAMKIAAGHVSSGRRGLAIGTLVGALTLGTAVPHLAAAFADGRLPYRAVLVQASLLAVIGALLIARYSQDGPYAARPAPFDPRQIGRVVRNRPVVLATLGYLGHMWELYAMWTWIGIFLAAAWRDAPASAARLAAFAIIGVAGCAGAIAAGWIADRVGRTLVTIAAMLVSGACCVLAGWFWAAPAWALVAFGLVWGAAAVADSAQFSASVTELAEPRYVGTALTLQTSLGFALTMATIWGLPLLAEQSGWRWVFLVLAPGPLLGCVAMAALRRRPEAVRMAAGRR